MTLFYTWPQPVAYSSAKPETTNSTRKWHKNTKKQYNKCQVVPLVKPV